MPYTRAYTFAPLAARTDHTQSPWPSQQLQGERAFRVDIEVTAFSGTSITFTLQFQDPASGNWNTLLASAAIAATGHTVLQVGPNVPTAANTAVQTVPPRNWRLTTAGTITSVTWGASVIYGY